MKIIKGESRNFSAVERGIGFALHPSIKDFYSTQLSGDTHAIYKGLKLELVDVRDEDEFIRLQENILGHLVMLRRLKLAATVFIATVKEDNRLISIDNESGNVVYEFLGSSRRVILEPSVHDFLNKLAKYSSIPSSRG